MKTATVSITLLLCGLICKAQTLKIGWDENMMISKSTPTLQVVGNPMLRPQGAMREGAINALKKSWGRLCTVCALVSLP